MMVMSMFCVLCFGWFMVHGSWMAWEGRWGDEWMSMSRRLRGFVGDVVGDVVGDLLGNRGLWGD